MTKVIAYALDYGTSNSLLKPIFSDSYTSSDDIFQLKSIVFCNEDFEWAFGDEAIDEYTDDPMSGRLFKSIKRFMPEESFKGTQLYHKFYSLPDLISVQMRHMKEMADRKYQQTVDRVVVGHPALFSENEESHKLALKRLEMAAKVAGFKTVEFCPEPIAAAYNYHQTMKEDKLILVVDLGGGTSDFTICKLGPGEFRTDDVLALHGVPMAGDQFDSVIMENKLAPYYGSQVKYQLPMSQNWLEFPKSFLHKLCKPADLLMLSGATSERFIKEAQRYSQSENDKEKLDLLLNLLDERLGFALFREIEQAKIRLSNQNFSSLKFEPFGELHFDEQISVNEFMDYSEYSVGKIFKALKETLQKADILPDKIDHVFVTGGTAQIPMIQNKLKTMFGTRLKHGTVFQSVVAGLSEHGKKIF